MPCKTLLRHPLSRTPIVLLAAAFIWGAPLANAKEYYKWVDEKGISHFSEKPVPGKNAVKIGGGTKKDDNSAEQPTTDATSAASGTATASTSAKSLNDATASNDEMCKSAKSRLSSLQSGQRIKLVGDDGKFVYLEAKQIQDEIAKTQALIKASCSSP